MTKTKTKKKVSKVESKTDEKDPKINLTLTLGALSFNSKADDFETAIKNISKESFGKVKTWGVFNLKKEGKISEIRLKPFQIKRVFFLSFPRNLLEKRLNILLK
jgi:hypothetical protein